VRSVFGADRAGEIRLALGGKLKADGMFERIEFQTSDGFTIAASVGIPPSSHPQPPMPAVVFVHEGESDRSEWASVTEACVARGWVTLAYDMRGHGESSGRWREEWYTEPGGIIADLKAALAYIGHRENVDSGRIAVVGSSVGGNLACVASALCDIQTTVALSHKTPAIFSLADSEELTFRSIFHLASQGDEDGDRARWANEVFQRTTPPRRLEISDGSGHGVAMFDEDPTVPDRILKWLSGTI
jgi:dienelactone hydrolase